MAEFEENCDLLHYRTWAYDNNSETFMHNIN